MDIETLGAAMALAKKKVLPEATAADAGSVMVVGSDGTWTKAEAVVGAVITVSGTTMTVTQSEEANE